MSSNDQHSVKKKKKLEPTEMKVHQSQKEVTADKVIEHRQKMSTQHSVKAH